MVRSLDPAGDASRVAILVRFPQAMVSVIACTLVSGVMGGLVGALLARLAPSFLRRIHSPAGTAFFQADEFGIGLGAVCGLVMGAAAGVFVVCVLAIRDAWLARSAIVVSKPVASPGLLE
jgi:hypothetical protein